MTSLNNKMSKWFKTNMYKVNNWSTRAMKAWDVLHHATWVNNNLTLKTIQMCMLWFSAQSLQVRVLERPKVNTQTRLENHMSETPALQHYLVGLTIETGSGIVKDWTTWLYNGICAMLNSCTSTQKQADIDLSRGRWHQEMMSLINNANLTWHI